MKPALTGKGPDFSLLDEKECRLGNYQLRYKLPGNPINSGHAKKAKPSQVNLQKSLFDAYDCEKEFNRRFVRVEFEWWAYKGLFFQGHLGNLSQFSMYIDVNRREPHSSFEEGKLSHFEDYLKQDYWQYYETESNPDGQPGANWEKRNRTDPNNPYIDNSGSPLVQLPERYEREQINGTEWLHYQIQGEGVGRGLNDYWAYPINSDFYLTISYWMSSEQGDKDSRYLRMLDDARRIMSMVELSKASAAPI
ncbi:hypothetical protein [Hahella ganghwensis]|uniref:hypothetical protein n=1 Tax=Hahella ganghwensis TaxID=286420 RepID=UPI001FE238C9|nr:hypothetical protein [Hahella ganghwensis]